MIDWLELKESIKGKLGKNSPTNLPDVPEIQEMKDNLKNYPADSFEWFNLYPGQDFSNSVVDQFAKQHNLTCCRAWISIINPGKTAPWHWDWDANLPEYESKGSVVRYSVSLGDDIGHVFMCGKTVYYNLEAGTEIKWSNYKEWHGAANFGFTPYRLFHFLGYQ